MNCNGCGNKINGNEEFCPYCGNKLISDNGNNTLSPLNNTAVPLFTSFKDFFVKNRKIIIICLSSILFIVILIIFYACFFGFESLNWDQKYSNYKLDYIMQGTIDLGIDLSDSSKLNKIKITATCGSFELNKNVITWDLSDSLGECTVTAQYKHKKINKTVTVLDENIIDQELAFNLDQELVDDEDIDFDNLTNKQEKEYGTNPELADSDMDGLLDDYEIFTSKTDPNKVDTDGDGLSDGTEIELNLDPLKVSTKNDGIKDGDREITYNYNDAALGVNLEINGKGNLADIVVNTFNNPSFNNKTGLLNKVYNFYTAGEIKSAIVQIKYDLDEIQAKGLNEDNLTLYYFNDDTKELEKVLTEVDKENKILKVKLNHFSKYVIGDSDLVTTNGNVDILFIIDNSISMYDEAQMIAAGYNESRGAIGNDVSFKRLSLTNNMINLFTGNYRFAVAEFSGNYVKLSSFTNNVSESKDAVNRMKSNWESDGSGTNIIVALQSGIDEFEDDDNSHYIMLLTDGKNTEGSLSSKRQAIINKAKEKNVKICVIGLGEDIDDVVLSDIAESTECSYYNASYDNALDEIYEVAGSAINYNQVDTDGNGTINGTVIADSGFLVNRDGFSFENYNSNLETGGHCYGMATFAELNYANKLPLTLGSKTVKDKTSYAYNLNNTYFSKGNNLYDFKLQSEDLVYTFSQYFNYRTPTDFFLGIKDKMLLINPKYKEELIKKGLYSFLPLNEKVPYTKKEQINYWGGAFDKIEWVYLNEDYMQTSDKLTNDEVQLFNALYAMFIKQLDQENYSSASNLVLALRNHYGTESTQKINSESFIQLLKDRLDSGDAPVISSCYDGGFMECGFHSINAISLVQDNKDANHYYIGVYDNNHPGEKRYVDIKCNKRVCVTASNDYYNKSNQPIRISFSLEDDLAYFEE